MWALAMVPRGDLAEMKMRLLVSKGLVWGWGGGRSLLPWVCVGGNLGIEQLLTVSSKTNLTS